jgi:hypothetical protein
MRSVDSSDLGFSASVASLGTANSSTSAFSCTTLFSSSEAVSSSAAYREKDKLNNNDNRTVKVILTISFI